MNQTINHPETDENATPEMTSYPLDRQRPQPNPRRPDQALPDPIRDAAFYDSVPAKRLLAWIVDSGVILAITLLAIPLLPFIPFILCAYLAWEAWNTRHEGWYSIGRSGPAT